MTKSELQHQQKLLYILIEDIICSVPAWKDAKIEITEITPTFKGLYVTYRKEGDIQSFARTIKYSELS